MSQAIQSKEKPDVYLFVYGSLRPDALNGRVCRDYLGKIDNLGGAFVQGRLYNISWFPGAKSSENPEDIIVGHLFRASAIEWPKVMTRLDQFEGYNGGPTSLFVRDKVKVCLAEGETVEAWIYYFNGEVSESSRIKSGDFINQGEGNGEG